MKPTMILGLAVCLLLIGCNDSRNPLSDPKISKADEQLIGVWRGRDETIGTDYHISQAGENFPGSILRITEVRHDHGKENPTGEYLAFPTVLGGKTFLNLVIDQTQIKSLNTKGWNAETVDGYTFLRYQVDGDRLVLWLIDEGAKERAIQSGKIKGVASQWYTTAYFSDTTENVARVVAEAGNSLWEKQEPLRFERVNAGKKP